MHFDLSNVIFIATANMLDPIPPALLDRMEVLEIPGYTREEKLEIAQRHLVPKQIAEHGLDRRSRSSCPTRRSTTIIEQYTREAGVRNLEREIASVIRGVAVKVAESQTYDPNAHAGGDRRDPRAAEVLLGGGGAHGDPGRGDGPGLDADGRRHPLHRGVARCPARGSLILTGQLGDVMKESARAALSLGAHARRGAGHHRRLREDATSTCTCPRARCRRTVRRRASRSRVALVSLLTGRRVRGDVAMTGEITLRGTVLPVGGIKEKVLAAHRAGIKRVVLPERNRKDIVDIPETVRAGAGARRS